MGTVVGIAPSVVRAAPLCCLFQVVPAPVMDTTGYEQWCGLLCFTPNLGAVQRQGGSAMLMDG